MSGKLRYILDAIFGATALCHKALLITNDTHFFAITSVTVQGC
jgi:predicted nucleic acid-binding protein